MEALGLFNLLEEYIAKAEYKIDEVEKIISQMQDDPRKTDIIDTLNQMTYALKSHKIKLEDIIDDMEYDHRDDYMFVAHHDTQSHKKIID